MLLIRWFFWLGVSAMAMATGILVVMFFVGRADDQSDVPVWVDHLLTWTRITPSVWSTSSKVLSRYWVWWASDSLQPPLLLTC